jgi:Arylsulfatase A and related enzymes
MNVFGKLTTVCCAVFGGVPLAAAQSMEKPNIVIILADDLGWGDVGYNGGDIKTPCIDRLAKDGVVLNYFYTAPICSPTRAGLLTGRYPNRFGLRQTVIPPWSEFGVDTTEVFLSDMLAEAGYVHRAAFGKWHLGHSKRAYLPLQRGFTRFYGHYNGAIDYFTHMREGELDWHRNEETCYDEGYATDLITKEAVESIRQYAKNPHRSLSTSHIMRPIVLCRRRKMISGCTDMRMTNRFTEVANKNWQGEGIPSAKHI